MGFRDLIVECDALIVIKTLKLDSKDRSTIGNIINEIKRIPSFLNLSFQFPPRNANEVAHTLVARGHNLTSPSHSRQQSKKMFELVKMGHFFLSSGMIYQK